MEWYQLHQIPSRAENIAQTFFFSGEAMGWGICWLFTTLSVKVILWMHLYLPSRRIRLTSVTEKKGKHEHRKTTSRKWRSILTPLLHPATAEGWMSKHHSCLWVKSQPPHVLKWRAAAVIAYGTADGSQGLGCPLLGAKTTAKDGYTLEELTEAESLPIWGLERNWKEGSHTTKPQNGINSLYKMFLLKWNIKTNLLVQHLTELPRAVIGRGMPQTAQHSNWISPGRGS